MECLTDENQNILDFVYPNKGAGIYLPTDLDQHQEELILEATHQDMNAKIFWHLNSKYIGFTEGFHTVSIPIQSGKHELRIVDQYGNFAVRKFDVISSE